VNSHVRSGFETAHPSLSVFGLPSEGLNEDLHGSEF